MFKVKYDGLRSVRFKKQDLEEAAERQIDVSKVCRDALEKALYLARMRAEKKESR